MTDNARIQARLSQVPETLLWNLYQRACEARRPGGVLTDPRAVTLAGRIDYPFAQRFGAGGLGQWQALRARCFDGAVQRFLARHPAGTVVALGEGLETQFWRVDNGQVRWLTVDLPETIALRHALLPPESARQRMIACSALAEDWLDEVTGDPAAVLLTAQGLLMYFQPDEVRQLITACAARLPGSALVFDGVPPWFSARTLSGTMRSRQGYQAPPMPWAVDAAELDRLRSLPGVCELAELRPPRGRGLLHGALLPLLRRLPAIRGLGLAGLPVTLLRFGEQAGAPVPSGK